MITNTSTSTTSTDRFEVYGDTTMVDLAERFGDATMVDLVDRERVA